MADDTDELDLDFPDDADMGAEADAPDVDEPEAPAEAAAEPDHDEPEVYTKYSKHVQKRIDKLTWEREEEHRQAEALKAELEQLRQQLGSRQAQDQAGELDAKRREVLRELKRMDDEFEDDEDKRLQLQDQLTDLNFDLAAIRRQAAPPPQQKPVAQQEENPAVAAAQQWVSGHPEYLRNANYKQAVDTLYDQLVAEGYNPAHPRLFQELESRLQQPRRSGSPVAPPARGGEGGGKTAFTNSDMAAMKAAGMDPYDAKQRAKYIRSQRELG